MLSTWLHALPGLARWHAIGLACASSEPWTNRPKLHRLRVVAQPEINYVVPWLAKPLIPFVIHSTVMLNWLLLIRGESNPDPLIHAETNVKLLILVPG